MKKLYVLLSLLSAPAIAQPAFDAFPTIANNTTSTYKTTDYTGTAPSSTSGSNVTWDFSDVIFGTEENSTTVYTNMASSTHSSTFPTANLFGRNTDGSEIFLNVNSTTQTILGQHIDGEDVYIIHTDPEISLTLPLAYNASTSDNFEGHFTWDDYYSTYTGTIMTTYDAYGTLITPNGTFTNIGRLKTVRDETQTTDYDGDVHTFRYVSTTYSWQYPGEFDSRFTIDNIKDYHDGVFNPATETTTASINTATVTGLANTSRAAYALVYPQPAKNEINISAAELLGECSAVIYAIGGEAVLNQQGSADANHVLTLDIQSLQKGMYVVEVNNNDKLYRSKLIVN